MSFSRFAPVVSLLVLTCTPAYVSADIAPLRAEDLNCRPGTVGTTPTIEEGATDPRGRPLRPSPYCAAAPECTGNDACPEGQVCSPAPIGLCLEEREVAPGQRVGVPRSRGCEPDGTCLNINSTCENVRRCVPSDSAEASAAPAETEPAETEPAEIAAEEPDAPAAEASESSGGCSVSFSAPSSAWVLVLPIAFFFGRRRRA